MSEINRLLTIMVRLRDPEHGCPWDVEQTFATIAPYTLEEAHEVADAIARKDYRNLEEELGDLLLQIVFHAQMADEAQLFNFEDVARGISEKMLRRHPHVFPQGRLDAEKVAISSAQVATAWERIKAEEKAARGEYGTRLLDGIGSGQPGLTRALMLQKRAGKVGFDWNDPRAVIAKIREELAEVEAELDGGDKAAQEEELGDLLFCVVNLARHLSLDSESALKKANAKFERRFAHIEDSLAARSLQFTDASLAEMEALWLEAKQLESSRLVKNVTRVSRARKK